MKILLVDDDGFYREIIGKALDQIHQNDYVTASGGEEAIQLAQNENFDLLITDLMMPGKDGMDVIQEIRELHPAIKILAISSGGAAGHTSFLEIAEAFGANAVLQKPFTATQLHEKIEVLSGQKFSQIRAG